MKENSLPEYKSAEQIAQEFEEMGIGLYPVSEADGPIYRQLVAEKLAEIQKASQSAVEYDDTSDDK